ncbi:MAG: GNAT family N-acetyltransferase [Bacteroidetes bacterium]|nr:GNAT family N-acetyltransferase [Bacteroidota bacterium]
MNYRFQKESAMDLRSLRFLVLWPHKSRIEDCILDADGYADTLHFSARDENNVVIACCTVVAELRVIENCSCAYRLRAMATHPAIRGTGVGKALLEFAMSHYPNQHFWCDARQVAVPFYEKCGWQVYSSVYDIPQIGPHFLMMK